MHLTDNELLAILRDRFTRENGSDLRQFDNIRELLQVCGKLKVSEQLKTNFLSNVRNEINNPLSSILGLSKMLASVTEENFEQFKSKAVMLYHEAFQLDCKIRNIIAAAEIEAGEARPDLVRMNVRNVIETTVGSFDFRSEQKRLKVAIHFDLHGSDEFITDPYMFFIVVMNLVANAIEFSRPATAVTVSVKKEPDMVVEVTDSGNGIKQEDCERIFDRFRQLDDGSTKRHNGQGLGLSVAREFAEMLGGTLQLKASGSEGSVFRFSLPSRENLDVRHNAVSGWNDMLFGTTEIV